MERASPICTVSQSDTTTFTMADSIEKAVIRIRQAEIETLVMGRPKMAGEEVPVVPKPVAVCKGSSKGLVTVTLPRGVRKVRGVDIRVNAVVSQDSLVALEDAAREAGSPTGRPNCVGVTRNTGKSTFTATGGEGNDVDITAISGENYTAAETPMDVRIKQRDRIFKYVAPMPRDEFCMFVALPSVGGQASATRVFTGWNNQKPVEMRTVRKPTSLAFVPKGTPKSWVRSAIHKMEDVATF